ncbi:hypothetical protein BDV96DRAFT_679348 [Lophiotrema nucula]|uniref:Shugoshin n=1 Tax=Lophiotrema nucula TaxID=690887 RepID=A0A6A5ZFQ1_9PLEO|nr:hypothetical protein BDV96DRAFT_679348 [Lophiotrema nucula]
MARLNEPPLAPAPLVSTETIDAGEFIPDARRDTTPGVLRLTALPITVKRRCLRQNRELAKYVDTAIYVLGVVGLIQCRRINSQQSIRIRNLETEGSRLLAENLSLREQVLQLQNALESHSSRPSFESIDTVREKLESKIQELGNIIVELGQLKKENPRPRCRSQTAATKRSPGERQWRSGLGLQEVENAMLPTIAEGKFFPRQTMKYSEDPIAFNTMTSTEDQPDEPIEESDPVLSVNLETRRKRRESGPKLSIRRLSVFQPSPEGLDESSMKGVRAGAKRKMSVREDEEKANANASEAFTFSRRNTPASNGNDSESQSSGPRSPPRLVLGSKPVNTDPVISPKKQRSSASDKPEKKPLGASKQARSRSSISRNTTQLPPLDLPEPAPVADINLDTLPPKTPAVEDIFSPPSTEPSTSRPETKDTPPPGDLGLHDQTGRPSRRARAQVSYKEPSLHTKMRRPGKELVDAVQPQHDRRQSAEPIAPMTTSKAFIKGESIETDGWKTLPAASGRSQDPEFGSPLREKLGRKEGGPGAEPVGMPEQPKLNSSAASNAISALIQGSNASKRKPVSEANTSSLTSSTSTASRPRETSVKFASSTDVKTPEDQEQGRDSMAIFDINDSSPYEGAGRPRVDLAKIAKARRHSSIPASASPEERVSEVKSRPDGILPSLHNRTSSIRSASTTSLGKSTTTSTSTGRIVPKEKRVGVLPSSSSSVDLKTAAEGSGSSVTGSLRAERAASRRKSMML